jgi:D-alanine-D-alanine ligase
MPVSTLKFREEVLPADIAAVRELVTATGFFSPAEIGIAVELVETRITQGPGSGYAFLFAETDGRLSGYTCFGPIPGTDGSYDLYWIAVAPEDQGQGLGRELLRRTEARIRQEGGRQVYIETSSLAQYRPTQGFYRAAGYLQEAHLEDFYRPGDGKLIYRRILCGPGGDH